MKAFRLRLIRIVLLSTSNPAEDDCDLSSETNLTSSPLDPMAVTRFFIFDSTDAHLSSGVVPSSLAIKAGDPVFALDSAI